MADAKGFSVFVNIGGKISPSLGAAIRGVETQLKTLKGSFSSLGGVLAGAGVVAGLSALVKAGDAFNTQVISMKNAGRTLGEVNEGIAKSWAILKDVPTSSLTETLSILKETTGALGSFHHALDELPFTTKLGEALKFGLHVTDPGHALQQLSSFAELAGRANDPKKFHALLEGAEKAMVFFGGRVSADDFKTFASNATGSVSLLGDRFLTKILPSMIQETSADKVGTGLTGFNRLISGQRITDKGQVKAFASLGLLDPRDVITNPKNGEMKGWRAGAISQTGLAYNDPLEWVEKVLLPRLAKSGVNLNDQESLRKGLSQLFKDKRGFDFVWSLATQANRTRLHKDEDLIGKVLGLDKQYDNAIHSISFAVDGLKNSFANLGVALTASSGHGVAGAIGAMSRSINTLAHAIAVHPWLGKTITGLAVALSGIAAVSLGGTVTGLLGLSSVIGLPVVAVGTVLGALYFLKEWNPGGIVQKISAIDDALMDFQIRFDAKTDIEGWLDRTFGTPAQVGEHFKALAQAGWDSLVNFDWGAAGRAIVDKITAPFAAIGAKIKSFLPQLQPNGTPGAELPMSPDDLMYGGKRAAGGPVAGGKVYIIGERGPEFFIPGQGGMILPNEAVSAYMGGGGLGGGMSLGGGGIPGARGGWGGGMGRVGGSSPWHTSSQEDRAAFIRSYAESIGMDPKVALRVAQSEGFYNGLGDGGRSFGDFQLFTGGGIGNRALAAGINIRDPNNWKAADKYALDVAKREGWSAWHGAAKVGIANWQGINAARAAARSRPHQMVSAPINVTINGATDPRAVHAEVKQALDHHIRRLERHQRGALSD